MSSEAFFMRKKGVSVKEYYVCDECKKLMKPKDEIVHVIGSKGELYFCKKCAKDYIAATKA